MGTEIYNGISINLIKLNKIVAHNGAEDCHRIADFDEQHRRSRGEDHALDVIVTIRRWHTARLTRFAFLQDRVAAPQ